MNKNIQDKFHALETALRETYGIPFSVELVARFNQTEGVSLERAKEIANEIGVSIGCNSGYVHNMDDGLCVSRHRLNSGAYTHVDLYLKTDQRIPEEESWKRWQPEPVAQPEQAQRAEQGAVA